MEGDQPSDYALRKVVKPRRVRSRSWQSRNVLASDSRLGMAYMEKLDNSMSEPRGSLQNRPVERIQDSHIFTSSVIVSASFLASESSSAQQLGIY
jgi:hypothetical protein